MFQKLNPLFTALILALASIAQHAHAVTWSATGPGETSILVDGDTVIFNYSLDVSRTSGLFEWTLRGRRFIPDTHVFNWSYDGSHDRRQKQTILTAPDHVLVSAGSGSGAFSYQGRGLSIRNDRWDDFVFTVTAKNDDATKLLSGTLEIRAVPVPSTVLMLLLGLTCLGAVARRRHLRPVEATA